MERRVGDGTGPLGGTWATTSFSTEGSINDPVSDNGDDDTVTSASSVSAAAHERDASEPGISTVSAPAQWSLGLSITPEGSIRRVAAALAVVNNSAVSSDGNGDGDPGSGVISNSSSNDNGSGSSSSSNRLPVESLIEEPLIAVQTAPLPESALVYLDHSLAGPVRKLCVLSSCERFCINRMNHAWFHRRIRLRVWLGTACGQTITGGYLLQYFFSLMGSNTWATIGYLGFANFTIIGALMVEGSLQAARAVVDTRARGSILEGGRPARAGPHGESFLEDSAQSPRGSHFLFVTTLLKSEVTEATAMSASRSVKFARVQAIMYLLLIVGCYVSMLMGVRTRPLQNSSGDIDWENLTHQLIAVAGMCLCPCTAMVLSGWLLFVSLPCMIVADHIRMSAYQVSALEQASSGSDRQLPWNSIMTAVQEAHVKTVKLGSVVAPLLTVEHSILALLVVWFAILGVVSRTSLEADDDGWPAAGVFLVYMPAPLCCLASIVTAVFAESQMFGPADVTLACDELVEAIRSLRVRTDEHGGPLLSEPRSLIRVEGIARFADELNRGQGLGFCFRKRRVTPQMVSAVLAKSVLWMVLAFPTYTCVRYLGFESVTQSGRDLGSQPLNLTSVSDVLDRDPMVWSGAITLFVAPLLLLGACLVFRAKRLANAPDQPLEDLERL